MASARVQRGGVATLVVLMSIAMMAPGSHAFSPRRWLLQAIGGADPSPQAPIPDLGLSNPFGKKAPPRAKPGPMGGGMVEPPLAPGGNLTYALQLLQLSGIDIANSTVFAPINSAFEALPTNTSLTNITDLLNATLVDSPLSANLTDILALHVIPGVELNSTSIPPGNTTLTTLNGMNITVTNEAGGIFVTVPGGSPVVASVIQPDVQLEPGTLVHVIDSVLLPFATPNDVLVGPEGIPVAGGTP